MTLVLRLSLQRLPLRWAAPKDSSEYTYDALDRTIQEDEDHESTANDRRTVFSFFWG